MLHSSGTDRLIVAWSIGQLAAVQPATEASYADVPIACSETLGASIVRIEIPAEVGQLGPAEAWQWRVRTREAFVQFMGSGYRVSGFYRSADQRCYYVLTQGTATAR